MSKLNLNSIISWVDSYIIDYLTALTKNKKVLFLVCFISVILLLFFSPIYGGFWLLFPTVYFLYSKSYKNIFIAWGFFFLSWYLIFTGCMFGFDGPIVVGSDFIGCGIKAEETVRIHFYVSDKYYNSVTPHGFFDVFLGNLCVETLFILALLSSKLGFSIYIPSLFKGLSALFKFLFGGKGSTGSGSYRDKGSTGSGSYKGKDSTGSGFGRGFSASCSPIKESEKSDSSTPDRSASWFSGKGQTPKETSEEFDSPTDPRRRFPWSGLNPEVDVYGECKKLSSIMSRNKGLLDSKLVKEEARVVKGTRISVLEIGNMFLERTTACTHRKATAAEIAAEKALRAYKKNAKK